SVPAPPQRQRPAIQGATDSRLLQRKCACGGTSGPKEECEECDKQRLQRKASPLSTFNSQHSVVPPIVHDVIASPGQSLDRQTRAFMEPHFGYDFSLVRIHADSRAAESARSVNALAYTVGTDIAFAAGQFRPDTPMGRQLLAHELTHVVQ